MRKLRNILLVGGCLLLAASGAQAQQISIGGDNGISVGVDTSNGLGVDASVGGSSGINADATVGGSDSVADVNASVGGSDGVNANAGVTTGDGLDAGVTASVGRGIDADIGIGLGGATPPGGGQQPPGANDITAPGAEGAAQLQAFQAMSSDQQQRILTRCAGISSGSADRALADLCRLLRLSASR